MLTATPLSTIIALARAGALDHAWAQFCAAGYDRSDDDPAALTVKGRLLKDHALRAADEASGGASTCSRPSAYRRAGGAAAGDLSADQRRDPLAALRRPRPGRGDRARGARADRARARRAGDALLARRDRGRGAAAARPARRGARRRSRRRSRRRRGPGRTMPRRCASSSPSTRRSAAIRPGSTCCGRRARSIIRPTRRPAPIRTRRRPLALEPDIGFGFGALAAGAELLAAEALLERGAELHVILPSDAASFAAAFVDPHRRGVAARASTPRWRPRRASATCARCGRPPDAAPIALADRIACGAALLNAERLMGEAVRVAAARRRRR